MAKRLQLRKGTTLEHSTFTGAVAEVTIDTDKDTLVVHDGVTAGGHALRKETDSYTKTEVDTAFTNLVNGASVGYDTLGEIETAIGTKQDSITAVQKDSDTGVAHLPAGTTAQRPVTPIAGDTRMNIETNALEYYTGTIWESGASSTAIDAALGTIYEGLA